MKIEDRQFISFTRKELVAAMLAAAGLPADTQVNRFSVESTALAEPQPVVAMSVTLAERDRPISALSSPEDEQ